MANFFIDRPIFAWVIAIVTMLAGALAIFTLPIAQYPTIAPPSVTISASYPGASAEAVENTVTQVIEQKMKGIDNLRYMSATSSSNGQMSIELTFEPGTDPDIAQVQVQNKLALATPLLPTQVQQQGVEVSKSSGSFLMVVGLVSDDGRLTQTDLADYLAANLQDPISRLSGVGDIDIFGAEYAMRVWLDPNKLNSYQLTSEDVVSAIEAQNVQVSAGQLGGTPAVSGQQLNASITVQVLQQTPEQFAAIVLRTQSDGSTVHLGDVARVEIGSESYDVLAHYNGAPAAGMGIKLATGANALDTAELIKDKIDELSAFFPAGVSMVIPYDTTPFVRVSILEVVKTLGEAIVLVFLVMYLFLQNIRATLIPTIAVPIVLLGTFGVLAAFGFSINTLTMFGMVLAIGLLVDDAIVVVENVERVMREDGLPPREATRKSMGQITGALIGIALVLSAVFVPMAFFSGSAGAIYRQFSITIVSAMALSVAVAMILTPALCASMLKHQDAGAHGHRRGPLAWFNRVFDKATDGYQGSVAYILRRGLRFLLVYAAIAAVMAALFLRMPSSFLPDEDQGILFAQVQLPVGATQERTLAVMEQVEKHFLENEKASVNSVFSVTGFSFSGSGQNAGIAFVSLKDWSEREGAGQDVHSIAGRAMAAFGGIRDALAFAFAPPAVIELGNASGFDLQLQDRGGLGHEQLIAARQQLLQMAAEDPRLVGVRANGKQDEPQFVIDIDRERAGALGVSLDAVNNVLSTAWGGSYVNDFINQGRIKKVYVQADAPFRMTPEDLDQWYVKNGNDKMVPVSAFAHAHWSYGSPRLERYNGLASVEVLGSAAPGQSTGKAMTAIEEMASRLPAGIGMEWTGLSDQERASGDQTPLLYSISILVVFLCLAALYESWSIPFSVLLILPLGIFGALAAASLRDLSNDIFFQVGLLTTVGLSAKNAILIVEFAKDLQDQGEDLVESTLQAVRMRLRPIVMTSLAFAFGVLPLALSNGAGSGGQNAIGTGVLGGMIAATLLGIFFVPLFFVLIRSTFGRKRKTAKHADPALEASA
jgi:multidrug efflux pump